jgi:Domain of unknown function (DUF4350)
VKGLSQWLPSAGLLALALLLGVAAGGGGTRQDDPRPSAKNPGPLGLEVLRVWLEETGAKVLQLESSLTQLPDRLAVLVIAAPKDQRLTGDELDAVKAWVHAGGTLIWLAPAEDLSVQSRLTEWLGARRGGPLGGLAIEDRADLGARTLEVQRRLGLTRGVDALRLSAGSGLGFDDEAMVQVVDGGALWARPMGEGEVWVAAGPQLAEARRLQHEGNLQFWANAAARGPIAFDEWHHVPEEGPPLTANIPSSLLQLLAVALAFAAVFGRRLGPPRSEPREVHRSSLEYVGALAALTQKAKVEPALLQELHGRLRRVFRDRLGVAVALADAEAAREVGDALGQPHEPVGALLSQLARPGEAGPSDFTRLATLAARLERSVVSLARG